MFYTLFCWICRSFAMTFAYVPFDMKSFKSSLNALNALYWFGLVISLLIILVTQFLPKPKSDLKKR